MVQLYSRSGGETVVNSVTQGFQGVPKIARLSSGGFVLAWSDNSGVGGDSSHYGVKAQIYDAAGAKVGGEFLVNTTTSASQMALSVAGTASGGFVVLFDDASTGGMKVQIFDSAGAKVGGQLFVDVNFPYPGDMYIGAQVTALTNGSFIVTWGKYSNNGFGFQGDVYAQAFNGATGAKLSNAFLLTTTAGDQLLPSITALPSGGWVATWTDSSGTLGESGDGIKGQVFAANGAKVGAEFRVNSIVADSQSDSVITALSGGGFAVAWVSRSFTNGVGENYDVRAQVFTDAGVMVGSEILVNTITAGQQRNVGIDDLANGGFVVTWTDTSLRGGDTSGIGIMAQAFGAGGAKVGTHFLVNGVTAGDQLAPAVAGLASGGFAVAWQNPVVGTAFDSDVKLQIFQPSAGATDIALSSASVRETAMGNYAVATLSDNGGVNGPKTYSLLADSTGGAFRIDGDKLVIADNSLLDHETAPTASLTIRVTDVNGDSYQEVIEVAIADAAVEDRYSAGAEFNAVSSTPGDQNAPAIGQLASGGYVMTWMDAGGNGGDGSGYAIKAQMFDGAGAKVGAELAVNTAATGPQVFPSVAGLASGGFVVAWEDDSGSGEAASGIRAQRFDSTGAKVGGELIVNTISTGDQEFPAVTALASGGFVVTWTDRSNSTPDDLGMGDVRGQIYDSAGAKVGSEFLVNTNAIQGQRDSSVAALPTGGFIVSWTDAYYTNVAVQRFDAAGNKVGGELHVGSFINTSFPTSIAVLASGGFVISWSGFNPENSSEDVRAQIFNADGSPLGDPFWVNTEVLNSQNYSSISALPWGGFVVSWMDNSGTGADPFYSGIRAQMFDSTGARIGGEFLVNAGIENSQDGPVSTVLTSGGFVVGWTDTFYNPSPKSTIEGRVFSLTPPGDGDNLTGDGNDNVINGGSGDDVIEGLGGNDSLDGGTGDDIVRGGTGNDRLLVSGTGAETAEGGDGADTLVVDYSDAGSNVIMAHPTNDAGGGYSGSFDDGGDRHIDYSSIHNFEIATGSGNDEIHGGLHRNIVSLGAGNDRFLGGGGIDTVDGGSGVDGVSAGLGLAASAIVWNLQTNSYSGPIGSYTNFEYFAGIGTGSANDTIVTTSANLNDIFTMGSGNDVATVINGQDHASGEFGNDLLIIDYSASTNAIVTTGGAAGITLGSDSSGVSGQIGDGGSRRVNFFNIDRFDVRTGSGNDDIVLGTGSLVTNDRISLGGGDDSADFGRGLDTGDGGAGVDSLAADISLAGVPISINLVTNSFSGPAGISFVNFEYFGGSGLRTGQGADTVVTGQINRNDIVALGAGNDIVTLHDGVDTVYGGTIAAGASNSGLDTLVLDYGAATASVANLGAIQSNGAGAFGQIGDGLTRHVTFQAIDRFLITTGVAGDSIVTAAGNDEIRTGGGNDSIAAGGGDDLLDGGTGADQMAGGAGNDVYVVDDAGDSVSENSGEGTDHVSTALAAYSLAANVENLTGTSAAGQTLTGNAAGNLVNAGSGNDVLHLWVGGGNDTVNAGAGLDNIFFGATLTSADVVNGGAGVDTLVVQGPYGSLTLTANITQIENVSILGGNNTNFGEPGTNRYDYVLTTHDSNFAAGVQARINGAALLEGEDFTFDGSAETDASYVVYGGKGKDTLTGGLGNDIFFYAEDRFASGDTVNGGAGYDGMFLRGNYTIDFNAPGYTGLFTNIENLTLTSATDERYARGGGTEFDYNLTLSDASVGAGKELTVSGALLMASETMILDASQETDGTLRLFGGRAADTLKGGALADLFHGNLGADILSGGGGADVFRYQDVAESNSAATDHILDFTPGTDRIELDRIDANSLAAGNQAFTWIGSNAFGATGAASAGQLRAYEQGGSWFVEGDTNGDGFGDFCIKVTLQGPTTLSASDFLL